jgi:hypothetical protein
MHETDPTTGDMLRDLRSLPADLIDDLPTLLVNRIGNSEQAFMRTENIIGHVEPWESYRVELSGLHKDADIAAIPMPAPIMPPYVELTGEWVSKPDYHNEDANIFGGNGRYIMRDGGDKLPIPVAETTPEHLAEYDSRLVSIGEVLRFRTSHNLPVTVTSIGERYVDDYLMDADKGGGAFLEIHDRPHFHMPLNRQAGGYLLIGKHYHGGERRVSAFNIPFGYGVMIEPWAIHSDSFLVGRYMVVYSATPEFSTVILRQSDGELAKIVIEPAT